MTFVIGVRYLCGWAMATHPSDRQRAEWPPHPDRVFMALAAAHFETDGGSDEYEALRRLSSLGPPALSVWEHSTPISTAGKIIKDFEAGGDESSVIWACGSPGR